MQDNAGSFTIHQTGSAIADPRNGPAGAPDFTVYVHLPDGISPTGADLRLADIDTALTTSASAISTVTVFGGCGSAWNKAPVSGLIGVQKGPP